VGAAASLETERPNETCPDENVLVRMIEGRLPEDSMRAIESHVDACSSCGALLDELAEVLTPGGSRERVAADGRIGRYEVRGEVGAGAMGVVYAAWDPELRRKVALKVLRPEAALTGDSSSARARLLREARLLATVSHPNVVAVYDVGAMGDDVFIAVELVEGRSLAEWITEERPRWREVVGVFTQIARGLAAAHASGLVHRDVKPANLLLGHDGRARVTDFGLATAPAAGAVSGVRASTTDSIATRTGAVVGTPAYMAPEQYAGRGADARSDQFSFCVSLGEALTGERPVAGATADDLREQCNAPVALLRVVARGLSARAADRFDSMTAIASALDACLESRSIAPPPPSARSVRSRRMAFLGWGAAACLAAVAAYGWVRPAGARQQTQQVARFDASFTAAQDAAPADLATTVEATPSSSAAPLAIGDAAAPAASLGPATDPDGANKALMAARRHWASGEGQACLADLATVAAGDPALGARSDVEKIRAQCEMFAGDCAGGRKRLVPLVGGGKSGKELEVALDSASTQPCRSTAPVQTGSTAAATKMQRLSKFYQDANTAHGAADTARCRKLNAELVAYVKAEGIAAEPQLKALANGASHVLTMCLATTNCPEAKRVFENKYRTLYPELMTPAEYDQALNKMFYQSFPQCAGK
jgi:hypothetical protein